MGTERIVAPNCANFGNIFVFYRHILARFFYRFQRVPYASFRDRKPTSVSINRNGGVFSEIFSMPGSSGTIDFGLEKLGGGVQKTQRISVDMARISLRMQTNGTPETRKFAALFVSSPHFRLSTRRRWWLHLTNVGVCGWT